MDSLTKWLKRTNYDKEESKFIINGFTTGFDIGYEGPRNRINVARNLPLTVGSKGELWMKVMKEVQLGQYSGLFSKSDIPYMHYIQSPIGLVPKARGKTRLISRLSYNFSENLDVDGSINYFTPDEQCTVHYKDLDIFVRACLCLLKETGVKLLQRDPSLHKNPPMLYFSKSDLAMAFRNLPIRNLDRNLLLMKAQNPKTGEMVFFIEKCLPFEASISCSHFQQFSNCLLHIVEWVTDKKWQTINYLNDYLFINTLRQACNAMVRAFLNICKDINFPVSLEKTEWAQDIVTFLGIIIDSRK